jgi:hypothetical protein
MDFSAKVKERRERLLLLKSESDALRGSFRRQWREIHGPLFWLEQGISLAAVLTGKGQRVGRLLSLFHNPFG